MKTWSPRVMQKFYKEWALEQAGKLLGKVRYSAGTSNSWIGEVYINGRTRTVYKGDNEQLARGTVLQYC